MRALSLLIATWLAAVLGSTVNATEQDIVSNGDAHVAGVDMDAVWHTPHVWSTSRKSTVFMAVPASSPVAHRIRDALWLMFLSCSRSVQA